MKALTPLRYPGGKSRAIKHIKQHFVTDFQEMREPFVGGGSVFLYLRTQYPDRKFWINDLYYNLYCFWITLRDEPDRMIANLSQLKSQHNKPELARNLHAQFRTEINTYDTFNRAVAFWTLNKCSYAGLTEIGTFSPQASEQNFTVSGINNLSKVALLLKDVKITNLDYTELMRADGNDVFCFLDPPYDILTKTQQNALYGPNGTLHKGFDHLLFADEFGKCKHKCMITYNDSQALRERFARFTVIPWSLKYSMQWNQDGKANTKSELLVLNY